MSSFDQFGLGVALSFLNQLDLIRGEALIPEVRQAVLERATDQQLETLRAVTP